MCYPQVDELIKLVSCFAHWSPYSYVYVLVQVRNTQEIEKELGSHDD